MFLISWNVAGWSSTSAAIKNSYGSIERFFQYTHADIICLQECKGTHAKLTSNPLEMGAADLPPTKRKTVPVLEGLEEDLETSQDCNDSINSKKKTRENTEFTCNAIHEWESFWSLSSKEHRGFNGVVTLAKKGLVHRCDNRPFGDAELDDEGRVVVTYFSHFVLFNVYVPNSRQGTRAAFKEKFLSSLVNVMEETRKKAQLPVILAGDLNMTYRAADSVWSLRRLPLQKLSSLRDTSLKLTDEEWRFQYPLLKKRDLLYAYNTTANYFAHYILDEFEKDPNGFVLSLKSNESAGTVAVKLKRIVEMIKEYMAEMKLPLSNFLYNGNDASPVSIEDLLSLGFRCAYLSELTKSFPFEHNKSLYAVTKHIGLAPHGEEAALFMERILHHPAETALLPGDVVVRQPKAHRMLDSFLLLQEDFSKQDRQAGEYSRTGEEDFPNPFTCWDQSHNCRLTNEGTRIDYILIDEELQTEVEVAKNKFHQWEKKADHSAPSFDIVTNSKEESSNSKSDEEFFYSEFNGKRRADGIRRVMADGLYSGAAYDGSGIPDLHDQARAYCLKGLPSSGFFITPPQFSDHIGVCLYLKTVQLERRGGKVSELNPNCMYRPAVGIQSFFTSALQKKASSSSEGAKNKIANNTHRNRTDNSVDAKQASSQEVNKAEGKGEPSEKKKKSDEHEVIEID